MYERRRQAASPVSLLAVTFIFVWACSSGGHNEEDSVTASGGAGSDVAVGSASSTVGGALFEGGAPNESGSAPSIDDAGSGDEPNVEEPPSESGGSGTVNRAGSGSVSRAGSASTAQGGADPAANAGGAGERAGDDTAGGATASAGTASAGAGAPPAVVEPVCENRTDTSTDGLVLPCEAQSAFFVCRNCHGEVPTKGVKSSFVTFQDIKPRAPQIYAMIKSGYMPWPPYTMSTYARNTALKWLGKDGSCAIGAAQGCQ